MACGSRRTGLAALALLLLAAASLAAGPHGFAPGEMLGALRAGDPDAHAWRILMHVRLPRTLAAVMAGSALAVSGLILQQVLANPMASPGLLGINAGAGLAALLCAAFLTASLWLLPVFAFAGALSAALIAYAIAGALGASRRTIILAGIAVSALLGAASDAIVSVVPDAALYRSAFSIGGFAGVTLRGLGAAAPWMLAGFALAGLLRARMRLLALGDEVAHSLGVRVRRARLLLLSASALLAAATVSFAGLIGFVGLVVPHLAGWRSGGAARPLPTALTGACLCLACDMIARTCFAPYELPVSVLLAGLGAPYLLALLLRRGAVHADV